MANWNGQKLAGAAGIVFVVATLVSVVMVSPPPGVDESPAKFLEYYDDNRSVLLAQMVVGLLALIPAFLFVGGFWSVLRRADEGSGAMANGTLIAFVTGMALIAAATGWPGALAFLADGNGLDEGSARTLSLLGTVTCTSAIFAAFAGAEIGSGVLLLRGSELPKWLGWIGLAAAVLGAAGVFGIAKSGAFAPFGFFSFAAFLGFLLYVVIVSVFLWLRSGSAAGAQA